MSEYKENTVGWWLSQLKEPLKSRALGMGHASLGEYSPSLKEAVEHIYELGEYGERDEPFWTGVQKAFSSMQPVYGNLFLGDKGWEGYNMAKECAPDNWLKPKDGGEDKAIVDSPEKPKNWIDQELWKWHTDMVKGGVEYADAERGKVKLVADSRGKSKPLNEP
jgi:hypothetical protein